MSIQTTYYENNLVKRACFFYPLYYTIGLLVTLHAVLYMVPDCIAVVKNGHSISGDLHEIFNIRRLCHLLIEVDSL